MRTLNPDYATKVCTVANECPFFMLLSMRLTELQIGRCLVEIDLGERHLQPFGVAHGGVFAAIIDAACFWAVYPEADDDVGMTTVDLKLNYLAPASAGKLVAEGRSIKLGKTLGLGEATVTDGNGKILAHGTSTLMVIPDFPFGNRDLPKKFL